MKKITAILLSICLLAACSSAAPEPKTPDFDALSAGLLENGGFTDILSPVDAEIAAMLYGVDAALIESCVFYVSTGATAEEIALFKAAGEDAASKLESAAKERVELQKKAFESYVPEEVPKLEKTIIIRSGEYVILVVSADAAAAESILKEQVDF